MNLPRSRVNFTKVLLSLEVTLRINLRLLNLDLSWKKTTSRFSFKNSRREVFKNKSLGYWMREPTILVYPRKKKELS